jgi:hypothetical protein
MADAKRRPSLTLKQIIIIKYILQLIEIIVY